MDPDKTLEELKELLQEHAQGAIQSFADLNDWADQVTEKFQALDYWITAKGFLPKNWQR